MVRRFQHLHEESVDGRVSDEFEEEEMLQTLQTDGAQRRQAEKQFGESVCRSNGTEPNLERGTRTFCGSYAIKLFKYLERKSF